VNPADRYLSDRVMTATPAQLTGILFEALSAAVRGAARLQQEGDFPSALPRSLKAQRILVELRTTLDHDAGPEIAGNLEALYSWCHGNLVRANRDRDPSATRSVLDVVEQLEEAWNVGCLGRVAQPA